MADAMVLSFYVLVWFAVKDKIRSLLVDLSSVSSSSIRGHWACFFFSKWYLFHQLEHSTILLMQFSGFGFISWKAEAYNSTNCVNNSRVATKIHTKVSVQGVLGHFSGWKQGGNLSAKCSHIHLHSFLLCTKPFTKVLCPVLTSLVEGSNTQCDWWECVPVSVSLMKVR